MVKITIEFYFYKMFIRILILIVKQVNSRVLNSIQLFIVIKIVIFFKPSNKNYLKY